MTKRRTRIGAFFGAAAALAFVAGVATPAAAQCGAPACQGSWVKHINFTMSPAAGALVSSPTGLKVMLWSSALPYQQGGSLPQTSYLTLDTATLIPGSVIVAKTNHDAFCPGVSMGPDGAIYVSGGYGGARPGSTQVSDASVVSRFDTSSAWSAMPHMNIPRAYHASALTSNGGIFVIGGSFGLAGLGGKDGELWMPGPTNPWVHLTNVTPEVIYTQDLRGVYRQDNHAWLFGWKNGFVFHAGPSIRMNWFHTTVPGGQTFLAGYRGISDQMNGNAVMFDNGKILAHSGAANYDNKPNLWNVTTIAVNLAYVITLGFAGRPVKVQPTGRLTYNRTFCTSVPLPTGDVLAVGGQRIPNEFYDTTAALIPELWQRSTGTWKPLAPMPIPRTYHSLALLLPDASVLVAGGGLCPKRKCPAQHRDGDVFYPPYFFDSTGALAKRPVIKAPSSAALASYIRVTSTMAVTTFALIRFGSSTHAVDTDQRRLQLSFKPVSGQYAYNVKIPGDPGVVNYGYWLLFGLTSGGTPSVGAPIHIAP